jgi:[acyl-carrier-protein] S-malonyltransferase
VKKTAFVFPGQGSQKVGMGASLCAEFPEAAAVFDQANELLGFDLKQLCFEGPEETLKQTENAQVALYTCSVAALRAFEARSSYRASACAGHSVGEYAALTAAGALQFADGLKLVRTRGELMRDAGLEMEGTMAAILGLEAEAARQACEEAAAEGAGVVTVANYNGGGQIVISGTLAGVQRAGEIAKEKGARKVIPLSVSGPFHSPLMVNAGDKLFASLSKTGFSKPTTPIITNVEARYVQAPSDVVAGLTMQVSGSVRWEESMQILVKDGIDSIIEFGSGEVLCGLMKRIDKSIATAAVTDAASLAATIALINSAESEGATG